MATKLVITPTGARAVYSDTWMPIYKALGIPQISRASNVEFDNAAGLWTATYIPTGEVIARGKMRAAVIQAEIVWLEKEVIR